MIARKSQMLRSVVLLLCCILGVFGTYGCSQPAGPKLNTGSAVDPSESEFERGRNRPPTARTLYAMADILAGQGKDSGCEIVLRKILREYPRYAPAYNSLAELLMRCGRTNEAVDIVSQGLRIHPADPVLLNNSGMCWLIRRDYKKALEMFTQAASQMPENARYRANMAVALGLMGRDEDSLALFRQVLPEDRASHNLSILRRARIDSNPDCKEKSSS